MPTVFSPVRQLPVALLLGLLALLLWGQCAFHLNESGSSTPPAPKLHLKTAVRVVRLDSVSAHAPDVLYVTIGLQNLSGKPCELTNFSCGLRFDKQALGSGFLRKAADIPLAARGEQVFQVAITPYRATDYRKGTDFGQLRAAWQQGSLARHRAQLEATYFCAADQNGARAVRRRIQVLPLAR